MKLINTFYRLYLPNEQLKLNQQILETFAHSSHLLATYSVEMGLCHPLVSPYFTNDIIKHKEGKELPLCSRKKKRVNIKLCVTEKALFEEKYDCK